MNDTLGHEAGDQLLKMATERLTKGVRKADTVARLGGDEFIILLGSICNSKDVDMVADKIIQRISASFVINGHKVQIGVSIGIAIYLDDTPVVESLVQFADKALYKAKESGRNCYVKYADIVDGK